MIIKYMCENCENIIEVPLDKMDNVGAFEFYDTEMRDEKGLSIRLESTCPLCVRMNSAEITVRYIIKLKDLKEQ